MTNNTIGEGRPDLLNSANITFGAVKKTKIKFDSPKNHKKFMTTTSSRISPIMDSKKKPFKKPKYFDR